MSYRLPRINGDSELIAHEHGHFLALGLYAHEKANGCIVEYGNGEAVCTFPDLVEDDLGPIESYALSVGGMVHDFARAGLPCPQEPLVAGWSDDELRCAEELERLCEAFGPTGGVAAALRIQETLGLLFSSESVRSYLAERIADGLHRMDLFERGLPPDEPVESTEPAVSQQAGNAATAATALVATIAAAGTPSVALTEAAEMLGALAPPMPPTPQPPPTPAPTTEQRIH